MRARKVSRLWISHVPIDVLRFDEALSRIEELVGAGRGGAVFTPNVDHVVMAEDLPAFREAYAAAELSVVDGKPLQWASRLLGNPLPEKISGADLIEPLMALAGRKGWGVYLLGGAPGVADEAGRRLARSHGVRVVGTSAPPLSERPSERAVQELVRRLGEARPELVLVALGAPKQELLIHRIKSRAAPAVLLGIGAGLDFVAGRVKRAPRWVSNAGFEWLYRLTREPARLWRRYLLRDPRFSRVLLRCALAGRLSP